MAHNSEMASGGMMYKQRLVMIGSDFQAILRLFLSNFRVCNVGINDARDFLIMSLRWIQMP